MMGAPQAGWRHITLTERRTPFDCAQQMQWLGEERYPEAEVLRVVLDNLNPHKVAALDEACEPSEARRIAKKLALHPTPKHGSWLNMAESEWSILQCQCLACRIPDAETLTHEVAAYEQRRNAMQATMNWQCTVADARVKLHRLYPSRSA
jgi:DDE superfamily endonuclease